MRADHDWLQIRQTIRSASQDFEPIEVRRETRVVCATCTANDWLDEFGKGTNRACPECEGAGARQVISSGVFRGIVQVLRGTQRLETAVGILYAGNAVVHTLDIYSGMIEGATEVITQGLTWEVVEVTRTPFRSRAWLSAVLRRKE